MTELQEKVRGVPGIPATYGDPSELFPREPIAEELSSFPRLPSTAQIPFVNVAGLLTSRPLRRPNRNKPIGETAPDQDSCEQEHTSTQLPAYDKLRELAKEFPPPQEWFDEDEKPF